MNRIFKYFPGRACSSYNVRQIRNKESADMPFENGMPARRMPDLMPNSSCSRAGRIARAAVRLAMTLAGMALCAQVARAGTVAEGPLFLTTNVKPNVMLMLDNSISMGGMLTTTLAGSPYDPLTTYLASVHCDTNAIADATFTTNTGTVNSTSPNPTPSPVISYGGSPYTSSSCSSAGGTWNTSGNGICTIVTTTNGTAASSTTTNSTTDPVTLATTTTTKVITNTPYTRKTTVVKKLVGTTPNPPLGSSSSCTSAGGTWSSSKCTITQKTVTTETGTNTSTVTRVDTTTPITYGTTIPKDFFGKKTTSGGTTTTGTKCFSPALTYTTTLPVPSTESTKDKRANWLNWYYSNEITKSTTVSKTRLKTAQDASAAWVNSLKSDVRIGFSTFNVDDGGYLWEVVDDLSATKKTNIVNRINAATASAHTPLAETMADIGRYFATGASNVVLRAGKSNASTQTMTNVLPSNLVNGTSWSGRTAIAGEPSFSSNPIQYSCQKSFAVVLTDGLPSSDQAISSNTYLSDYDGDCTDDPSDPNDNADATRCGIKSGSSWVTPHYDMKRAYNYPGTCNSSASACVTSGGSNSSDYFDDVTKALFEMDLRPDIQYNGTGSKPKNNLTTFVVGFADDAINPTIPGVNPLPKDAAVEGGGKFFFSGSEAELSGSLTRAFNFINDLKSSSSSVAANSSKLQTNSILFQALFDPSDWTGNIRAFNLDSEDTNNNGLLDTTPVNEDLNGNGKLDVGTIGSVRWEAKDLLPSHDVRRIMTYDAAAKIGAEFVWGSLNASQKTALDSASASSTSSRILDYLRGDQSNEGQGATEFRVRSTPLGDIINSDPLFVGGEDLGYSSFAGAEGSLYASHVALKSANQEMLYVGANDGMLHGFQVDVQPVQGAEGAEVFAYVPNAAISPELASLATNQNYIHKYFVDGAPIYGDSFYDNEWHSVLVGSMGAGNTTIRGDATGTGGRSVFALDITHPEAFGPASVLWEFSNRDDSDLGYTIPAASVVRLAGGGKGSNPGWVALVANGFNSANGKAVLFIRDIKTGEEIKKLTMPDASTGNGLSTPVAVDLDGDKIVDYVYAGDLRGNMWKIDVTGTDPNSWSVANSGVPLFVACAANENPCANANRQPITTRPGVIKAQAKDQNTGVMVYFGTGKYYENNGASGDQQVPVNPQIQTFYGIWDKCDKTNAPTCTDGAVTSRGLLEQQSITSEQTVAAFGEDVRLTTACEVAYGNTTPTPATGCVGGKNRRGWFMDLKSPVAGAQGERVVSNPVVRQTSVIFVTLIPVNQTCEPGGTGFLMDLKVSGASFSGSWIDANKDNRIDKNDLVAEKAISGIKSKSGIMKTPTTIAGGKNVVTVTAADGSTSTVAVGNTETQNVNTTDTTVGQYQTCEGGDDSCNGDGNGGGGPPPPKPGKRKSWRQLF